MSERGERGDGTGSDRRIGIVAGTRAGRAMADRLADALPGVVTVHSGDIAGQIAQAWRASDTLVCFLATGATIRLVAPMLAGKHADPGVVCVDEAGGHAIALLGGHAGGANAVAAEVAGVLGARAVISTASDATGAVALDEYAADLGFRLADRAGVAKAARALLDGGRVRLAADATWPVPPLPTVDSGDAGVTIAISDRLGAGGDLVYRPASLVVGVGASRGAPADEIAALVLSGLDEAGLALGSVRCLATADIKADEPGIVAVAARFGWPLVTYPAHELAGVAVPHPSEVVRAAVGTPSVAEAAALLAARAAGRAAELVLPKRASAMATVAVARLTPRGRLRIVGLGPGAADLRTPRATRALHRSSIVVGLDQYVDQVRHVLRPGTRTVASGLGAEEERARTAVELATAGHAVALIGSGDAGLYAMASPALQIAGADVDVEVVPGVTAALAASALLGAPLGHDHAYVSLSDLHTPWPVITSRLRACAAADLVLCLYNPRSAKRTAQFDEALAIVGEHRDAATPVGVVRDATRPGEHIRRLSLGELAADPSVVDMRSMVVVGSTRTAWTAGRMVTPREYGWLA